ncbi:MAG: 50S ribosomal protein L28 [Clostridia bacterium]|nr:50S ribosomal protein L28 [Clostridia bacterium]
MSRVCSVCGKGKMGGNKVSHSNRKSPRQWNANVQKVAIVDAKGTISSQYVCTRCLRSKKVQRKAI